MKKVTFIAFTDRGIEQAILLQREYPKSLIITSHKSDSEHVSVVDSVQEYVTENFAKRDAFCFVSALGICVRMIAPLLESKQEDPAIVCVDDHGRNAQSVISGHQGGANEFAKKIASVLGGNAVISTSSDLQDIWSLDLLAERFAWSNWTNRSINELIAIFVNNKPTAVLLDVRDEGTEYLERTAPDFVQFFYNQADIDLTAFELLIAITYKTIDLVIPTWAFYPKCVHLGSGCSKELDGNLFEDKLKELIVEEGIVFEAITSFGSIDIKAEQQAYLDFAERNEIEFLTYTSAEIETVDVPNPSEIVHSKIGVDGVSESTSMLMSGNSKLLVEKQKIALENGEKFTFALALNKSFERTARIAIVGAGPGDALLISVRGKELLEEAECVLYAGSLIPEEMTGWCKPGAVVQNSAMMTLEEQVDLMTEHYKKGNRIVRLQCGDPSLYGAIQEQMSIFDELEMDYYIVPGISSYSAAAAALKSEFTIPEVVQSIFLTRGEGKTPMPPKEDLAQMAKSNATMCIFLSVGIAKKIEGQLLEHYAADTPVAVLYRVTWKDEEIYQGTLENLAQIVKDSKKTRTVLIIVGQAIGARKNRSQLYSPDYKHIFRTNKKFTLN
ncbi:MAG: precorrin-4 C(11)-methyltransferase [Crocinitomicaceae bacterium]|nr:precorrin-4 C(11)-methyltransferase [Flavobacteriales bacterium]NQZ36810.1 precorrin-4 C(11)-methyltransferase [Crocinitomicaceae bacterium]